MSNIQYIARLTQEFLENFGLKLFKHLLYSSDLASCDFGLFPLIKKTLKKLFSNEKLIAVFNACADQPAEK